MTAEAELYKRTNGTNGSTKGEKGAIRGVQGYGQCAIYNNNTHKWILWYLSYISVKESKARWSSWQDSSAGKGTWCQAWEFDFHSQILQSGRQELIPTNYPLISTCVLWHDSLLPQPYKMKRNKLYAEMKMKSEKVI